MRIQRVHALFAGFTQKWESGYNGLSWAEYRIWEKFHTSPGTLINYFPWYIPSRDYCGMIEKYGRVPGNGDTTPFIHLTGYSFGGQSAVNCCLRFFEMGIPVQRLILIDPIRRNSTYPWGWLSAINRFRSFQIPTNVERVDWFWQSNNWPRSHVVKAIDCKKTSIVEHPLLKRKHANIDNAPEVFEEIINSAMYIQGLSV